MADYNLRIVTDDSQLESTLAVMSNMVESAEEVKNSVEEAFTTDAVEEFAGAVEGAESAVNKAAQATEKAAKAQDKLNKNTTKGVAGNKRLGASLVTNTLRMLGFSKEARVAGAALNILNRVSFKKVLSGIVNLGKATKNSLVSGASNAAKGFVSFASSAASSFKKVVLSANVASRGIKIALASTGIGLIVVAIGLVISKFDELKESGVLSFKNIVKVGLAPLTGGLSLLPGLTEKVGGKMEGVFGKVRDVVDSVVATTRNLLSTITGGLIDSADRAAERAASIAKQAQIDSLGARQKRLEDFTKLTNSEVDLETKAAKARGASLEELDDIARKGNQKRSIRARIELQNQKKLVEAINEQVKELKKVSTRSNEDADAFVAARVKSRKAQAELNAIQSEVKQISIDNARITEDSEARQKAAIERSNAARLEAARLEEQRLKVVQELREKLLLTEQERLIEQARLEFEANEKLIEANVKGVEKQNEFKLANDEQYFNKVSQIQSDFEQARLDLSNKITLSATDFKIQKINEETQTLIAEIQKRFTKEAGLQEEGDRLIRELQKNQAKKIQDLKRKENEKLDKEEAKRIKESISNQSKILESEKNFALLRVSSEVQAGEDAQEAAARAARERELIELNHQENLLQIKLDTNTQLSEADKKLIQSQLAGIRVQKDELLSEQQKAQDEIANQSQGFDLFGTIRSQVQSSLGLDDEQFESLTSAASQAASFVVDQFSQAADARLKAAEELVEFRNSEIDDLNNRLDQEIEINKLGLSSNIDGIREQIAQEKALRDEALAEQNKAAKQKQAIETLTQTSSLLTASANIYASLSAIPGFGVVAATAAVGAMLTAFAATKLKAADITKLAEGGLLEGPSHAQGGIKYTSIDGNKIKELEGNEFVMRKSSTMKNLPFLEEMNAGKFDNIDLLDTITNKDNINQANGLVLQYSNHLTANNKGTERELRESNRKLSENNRLLKEVVERGFFSTNEKGEKVHTQLKGSTEIITTYK